jgi:hypothetical protein
MNAKYSLIGTVKRGQLGWMISENKTLIKTHKEM